MTMRFSSRTVVILAVIMALLVELLATLGWWRWRATAQQVALSPQDGVEEITASGWLALPAAVQASRRLVAADLKGISDEALAAGLSRLGGLQTRWFPADAEGFKNRARAHFLRGEVAPGSELLNEALLRDPTSPYLHRLAALVLLRSGYPTQALDHLAQAQGLSPELGSPEVEVAPEDEDWVMIEGARRRVELYPRQRVQVLLDLARQLRTQGREGEAIAELEPVRNEPAVRLELAEWDLAAELSESAAQLVEPLTQRATVPKKLRVRAWSVLAQAREMAGDSAGAELAAEEALRLGPDWPAPYFALARLAERRGDLDGALGYMQRAWGVDPANITILLEVARLAERTGQIEDARFALERAADLAPDQPEIAARLIAFHLRHGDLLGAGMRLSRALERFPADPRLLELGARMGRQLREVTAQDRRQ